MSATAFLLNQTEVRITWGAGSRPSSVLVRFCQPAVEPLFWLEEFRAWAREVESVLLPGAERVFPSAAEVCELREVVELVFPPVAELCEQRARGERAWMPAAGLSLVLGLAVQALVLELQPERVSREPLEWELC
jgi:hypothetical protein